jgi:hypothetical protein
VSEPTQPLGRNLAVTVPKNCTQDEYVDFAYTVPANCSRNNTCPPLVCVAVDCADKYGDLKPAFNNLVSVRLHLLPILVHL